MTDSDWRPADWEKTKQKIKLDKETVRNIDSMSTVLRKLIDEIVEQIASEILDAYLAGGKIEEDACQYCRDNGWREPD